MSRKVKQNFYIKVTYQTATGKNFSQNFDKLTLSPREDVQTAVAQCNSLLADDSPTGFKGLWYDDAGDEVGNFTTDTVITAIVKIEEISKTEITEIIYE